MAQILVTGATGNAGREVVRALTDRGAAVKAGLRPGHRGIENNAAMARARIVPFDFRDSSTWPGALEGCRGVFLLRPPAISDVKQTLNPFIDAARKAGAGHIVFLSVAGAESNRFVPHHGVEKHLKRGPQGWTILRAGFFAQNLQDAYYRDIREDSRIYVPAGGGHVAFVDLRDVADLAADIFMADEPHDGAAYTLTGPEAVDFAEVATFLTRALGRRIRYEPASIPGYMLHLRRRGKPWVAVLVQTLLHAGLRFGQAEKVDVTLARLLGRKTRTIRDYITDNAHIWTP